MKWVLEDARINIHTFGRIAFIKWNRDGLLNGESSDNKREYGEAHIISSCMTRRRNCELKKEEEKDSS
jgi:hypothetical protein